MLGQKTGLWQPRRGEQLKQLKWNWADRPTIASSHRLWHCRNAAVVTSIPPSTPFPYMAIGWWLDVHLRRCEGVSLPELEVKASLELSCFSADVLDGCLMLYREITNVCSVTHKKHINILCVQNLETFKIRLLLPLWFNGLKLRYKNHLQNAL
jgi:hypothetical protein